MIRALQRNGTSLDPMQIGTERALVACVLHSEPEAMQMLGELEKLLTVPQHREICCAYRDVNESGETEPNLISVTNRLRQIGRLEAVGGPAAITAIAEGASGPGIFRSSLEYLRDAARDRHAAEIVESWQKGNLTLEELRGQLAEIDVPPRGFPPITDAAALVEQEKETPRDIVEGLLHKVGKLVFGGGSKSFKTWMLITLAVSVATASDFFGRRTTKGRALFINLEIQPAFFARRIVKVCEALGLKVESLRGNLDTWNLRGFAADFSRMLPLLLSRIRSGDYDLILVDPIYKVLGGRDENRAGDVATLLNDLERLAVRSGAAVAFGAHFSKGNQASKESIDRIGGSGVFARDPDSIITFTRHEQPDCFTVDCVLRNHAPIEPFVVRWKFPLMGVAESLDPERLKKPAGRRQEYAADDLLDLLDQPMTTVEWQTLAQTELGLSESTFFRRFRDIKKRGSAVQRSDSKWERK
jgi:hypothetical protein